MGPAPRAFGTAAAAAALAWALLASSYGAPVGADAAAQLVTLEGPLAFYKGALTHYLRLGPHMVLVFGILEQLKLLMR